MKQEAVDKILAQRSGTAASRKVCSAFLHEMADYEVETGSLFEDKSLDEIKAFLEGKRYSDIGTIKTKLIYIKQYMREVNKAIEIDRLSPYEFDLTAGMKEQLIPSLSELFDRLFLVYSPDQGDSIFAVSSLAWMGIPFSTAIQIKAEDVDLKNGKIKSYDKLLFEKMPDQMKDVLIRYRAVKSVRRNNRKIEIPDGRAEFIYKTVPIGSSRSGGEIRTGVVTYWYTQVCDVYNNTHTVRINMRNKDVTRSAKFYKLREMELSGIDLSASKNNRLLQETLQSDRMEPGEIRYNYSMYKKAFNLK